MPDSDLPPVSKTFLREPPTPSVSPVLLYSVAVVFSLPTLILLILWLISSVPGSWVIMSLPLLIVGQVCRFRWEWWYASTGPARK
jgi:hypothetical protein